MTFTLAAACCAVLVFTGCRQDGGKAAPPAAPRPHYGELMSEVGRRFETLGRAARAGRWELADFELDELGEVFEELPGAVPPEETGGVNLRGLEQAFTGTNLPALRQAVGSHDAEGFASAFSGAGVPRLDPIP